MCAIFTLSLKMVVTWSPRVLKEGRNGREKLEDAVAVKTGERMEFGKMCLLVRVAADRFFSSCLSAFTLLLALQLPFQSPVLFPSRFSSLSFLSRYRPTAHRCDNRKLKEAAADRYLALFGARSSRIA